MYLNKLSAKQKEIFLDICISLSNIDDDFANEERKVIDELCDEMSISPRYVTSKDSNLLIDEIVEISNPNERKIIFLELLGIAMADKKIAPKEKEFMERILKKFDFDEKALEEGILLVNELYDVYSKINNFLKWG